MTRCKMIVALWAMALSAAADETELETALRFETTAAKEGEPPPGWFANPPHTVALVRDVVHGGEGAARLARDAQSSGEFSVLTRSVDVDFSGEWIELRGMLRTEDVEGHASLWLRQDGASGMLHLDNMQDRGLSGSGDWQPLKIRHRLDERTRSVAIGVLLLGRGRVWADDLEFEVDGKPLAEAPKRIVPPTVIDTDREFIAGSGIDIDTLTATQVENVAVLGKVWGFLKYHHPRVSAGELHWDFELFRVLPRVLEAEDASTRNALLEAWIDGLGKLQRCEACAGQPDDVHLAAETQWIADVALLGLGVSARLRDIHAQRPALTEQFYLEPMPGVRNANFVHEPDYQDMKPPDAGYRILALLRLWNIIEYWFPYRDLLDDERDALLREFLPRVVQAADEDAYPLAMMAFIARIHDGHANLWSSMHLLPPRGDCHWPLALRFVEDAATVVELHADLAQGDVAVGDVVEAIEGVPVADVVRELAPLYAASNRAARLRAMARNLTRGECAEAQLTLRRGESLRTLTLQRSLESRQPHAHDRPGETFQRLSPEVAYLKLTGVKAADVAQYLEQAAGSRGLVIDIRNYPSEFVVFALGQHLVAEETPFARFTVPDPANPGAFSFTPPMSLTPVAPTYAGRVAILVDESSLSQAEYTAMAFRARPGAVVVGSQTAGADGNVSPIPLPGGLRTAISGIGVFYPDKTPTQRIGIVPDIEVRPTIEGIRAGRDEVLEAALAHILGEDADADAIRRMAARPR